MHNYNYGSYLYFSLIDDESGDSDGEGGEKERKVSNKVLAIIY